MKKLYHEHRIFVILMGFAAVCLILILFVLLRLFAFGSGNAPARTCDDVSDSLKNEIKTTLRAEGSVEDVAIRKGNRSNIIWLEITFNEEATLTTAKSKAIMAHEMFDETARECYDFQFMLSQEETAQVPGFRIMGARNVAGTNFVWNNNNPVETDEE